MSRGRRTRGLALAAALWCAWLPEVAADRASPTGDVVEVRRTTKVYARPRVEHRSLRGKLARSTRVRVLERGPATRRCRDGWLRIGDKSWLCARGVVETDRAPAARAMPRVEPGALLPHRYIVTRDGQAFASVADAAAGRAPTPLPGQGGFRIRDTESRSGERFFRTSEGWVAAADAEVVRPLSFAGVRFDGAEPTRARGFVRDRQAPLFDDRGGRTGETLAARAVLERWEPSALGAGFVEVAPGRVARRRDIARIEIQPRPADVAIDERWIDIDLSEQVLVAYQGDRPVLATLVSTGRRLTPVGTFRIWKKRAVSFMKSRPDATRVRWNIDTPWVMSLEGRIAMHAVYWHESLGRPVSHGCVNLAPRDARFLYDWTGPQVPAGWRARLVADEREGTLVQVRP